MGLLEPWPEFNRFFVDLLRAHLGIFQCVIELEPSCVDVDRLAIHHTRIAHDPVILFKQTPFGLGHIEIQQAVKKQLGSGDVARSHMLGNRCIDQLGLSLDQKHQVVKVDNMGKAHFIGNGDLLIQIVRAVEVHHNQAGFILQVVKPNLPAAKQILARLKWPLKLDG